MKPAASQASNITAPGMASSNCWAVALRASTISGWCPSSIKVVNSDMLMRGMAWLRWNRRRSRNLYSTNRPSKDSTTTSAVLPIALMVVRSSNEVSLAAAKSSFETQTKLAEAENRRLERDNELLWMVVAAVSRDGGQSTAFAVLRERGDD